MVALAISMLIVLAAVATLISAQRGYATVDAGAQLRENSRFATSLIERQVLQAGYQDLTSTTMTRKEAVLTRSNTSPDPDVMGFNDAAVTTASSPAGLVAGLSNNNCGAACVHGSDVLLVRYYGSSEVTPGTADGSMINCSGAPEKAVVDPTLADRAYSVFYVAMSSGAPTLMCGYRDASGNFQSVPLVGGVESFQVLYGVDSVTAGPTVANATGTTTTWLRADQLGSGATSFKAWRRVHRLRIGLLMRGPANTAIDRAATADSWYPLGEKLANAADPGSKVTITTADGRLRRTASFTVYLRNPLANCAPNPDPAAASACI